MDATQLMKLIVLMLMSSRTSMTPSMLETRRNLATIAYTKTTINIAWTGTTMTTTKTTTQAEIAIMIAKAAAMKTKTVTVLDVTTIVTKEAKDATAMMTGKEEITIVLLIKASHITWRKT
eukprot:6484244-Ditylum_brightwellii.AAC.1